MTRNPKRRGVTLIEILCALVLLAVVTGVLAVLITHTLEAQRIQASSYERLHQGKTLADQFRADVARAKKVLEQWGDDAAGPDTLILQMEEAKVIVYKTSERGVDRVPSPKTQETERLLPLPEGTGVEFIKDDAVIRMRLTPMRQKAQALEIAAALAGDWR